MKCSVETNCIDPNLEVIGDHVFCFNCYGGYEKDFKKPSTQQVIQRYQCCNEPGILETPIQDICRSCYTVHMKFDDKPTYLENDEYQTNVLYKVKKIHVPYNYLKKNFQKLNLKKYMILF